MDCRSQLSRGLRRRSDGARLLRLWVRIQPGAWISFCCEYCILSNRSLCEELITRPEESYWLQCVVVCDLETSWMRRPWPTGGCCAKNWKKQIIYYFCLCNLLNSRILYSTSLLIHRLPWSLRTIKFDCVIKSGVTSFGQSRNFTFMATEFFSFASLWGDLWKNCVSPTTRSNEMTVLCIVLYVWYQSNRLGLQPVMFHS